MRMVTFPMTGVVAEGQTTFSLKPVPEDDSAHVIGVKIHRLYVPSIVRKYTAPIRWVVDGTALFARKVPEPPLSYPLNLTWAALEELVATARPIVKRGKWVDLVVVGLPIAPEVAAEALPAVRQGTYAITDEVALS